MALSRLSPSLSLSSTHHHATTPLPRHTRVPRHHQPSSNPSQTVCSFSGGGGGYSQSQGGVFLPGQSSSGSNAGQSGNSGNAPYRPFQRPPSAAQQALSSDEMLQVLSERRGMWFDYAPCITALLGQGLSPGVLAEITGIQGSEQSTMVIGAQVYNTLKDSGCDFLSYFDVGGAEALYELRILSASQRRAAAQYVVEQRMDAKGARDLARAIKEHERRTREEGRDAFSISPADCMAFALYRQSKEVRDVERVAVLERALSYASSESARKKLQEALVSTPQGRAAEADAVQARVPVIRLRLDETFPRPLPVLGKLHELSGGEFRKGLAGVGLRSTEGPFQMFSPAKDSVWMAVPSWPALVAAQGTLAGLVVEEPDLVPGLQGKKLQGPLILVVETSGGAAAGPNDLVLAAVGDQLVVSTGGSSLESLGRIVVAMLPPKARDASADLELED